MGIFGVNCSVWNASRGIGVGVEYLYQQELLHLLMILHKLKGVLAYGGPRGYGVIGNAPAYSGRS